MSFRKEVLTALNKLLVAQEQILYYQSVIDTQREIISNLQSQLNKTLDRLMSRNFQELSVYTPYPSDIPSSELPDLEHLIGTVGAEPSVKPPSRADLFE
jgi:hypothetical protein